MVVSLTLGPRGACELECSLASGSVGRPGGRALCLLHEYVDMGAKQRLAASAGLLVASWQSCWPISPFSLAPLRSTRST